MKVPFVDLTAQYQSIKPEIDKAIAKVIADTSFIGGKYVKTFEDQFAKAYGVKNVISCGNGTDSLYIIMKMLGIGHDDEVITVANSWISSAETITQTGARVVFADVHPEYYSIDERWLESKLTKKTKAIIAVHLQGQPCKIDFIADFCKKHQLHLIEDCAQSHFSEYKGEKVGLFGIASSFSFYPGKNLGAYGDAGCMITNDDTLANKLRMYARHGALKKHQHQIEGVNSRMDGLQAAILSAKLPHLTQWTDRRIQNAKFYNHLLDGIPEIKLPKVRPESKHTFHLYVLQCQRRDKLSEFLHVQGVETFIHYPTPLPYLSAYEYLKHKPEDFPIANKLQFEILSIPMYPELSNEQMIYVANAIKEFYSIPS
jgi:dTDP-4-amino-4,6-dideoxygalactose transaminase